MRAHAVGLDPWAVLRSDDRAQRIAAEALIATAEHVRRSERETLASAVGQQVVTHLIAAFFGTPEGQPDE